MVNSAYKIAKKAMGFSSMEQAAYGKIPDGVFSANCFQKV
jgi:hypothetical protein